MIIAVISSVFIIFTYSTDVRRWPKIVFCQILGNVF